MDINSFTEDIEKNKWNVFGTEVYEDGSLIHSWGDTKGLYEIYSATKTILSVAVGIAWDRGLIDIDRSILDYIPEEYVNKMREEARNAYAKLSVKRFLTMSVDGFPFRAEGDNWLKYSLDIVPTAPEEERFSYSNISAYLVGVALNSAIGEDLGGFIEREIFASLSIKEYEYDRSPEGIFYGASKMKLSVHDLSKVGLMLCNKGIYEGKRILSDRYAEEATKVQRMNREGGYGFFIWKYKDGFSINGKLKQKCYCLPKRKLVITYLSHIEEDTPELKESMEKHILGIT